MQSSASLGVSYTLDAAGNQLGDGLKQYEHDASGRLARLSYLKSGTRMSVLYLHNAQGQKVFKSEPQADSTTPDPATSDPSFIDWLHTRFAWLFATTKKNDKTKLGTAFVYEGTDLLGEYGTGGANSTGSTEYIYLPTEQGNVLVGAIINGEKYAVHTDHLNTPRRMTDAANQPVWQWSYSAFGDNEPSVAARNFKDRSWAFAKGYLTDLQDGVDSVDNGPAFTKKMVKLNLRYPGQYFDDESNLHFNGFRTYDSRTGRYTQGDPIGLAGGLNPYNYVEGNQVSSTDPNGLSPASGALTGGRFGAAAGSVFGPVGTVVGGLLGAGIGAWIGWNVIGPMLAKPPENAYDPNGPKAPGKPTEADGFKDPKGGEDWVPNPNPGGGGSSWGWKDKKGDVWCPTGPEDRSRGISHGGPHWDVQSPGGGSRNVRPQR